MRSIIIVLSLSILSGFFLFSQDHDEIQNFLNKSKIEANQNQTQLILEGQIDLIDPKYTMDYISISRLSPGELRFLRNTFYAKYGYRFKSDDLVNQYSQFYWYKPDSSNVDGMLSDTDKRNIKLIQGFESIELDQEKKLNEEDIVGLWHIHFVMPSGWGDVFQFYPDGSFTYRYSQMRQLPIIFSFSGKYRVKGNALILQADAKEILESVNQETSYSGGWGHEWRNWDTDKVSYDAEYIFPLTGLLKVSDIVENAPESMKNNIVLQMGSLYFFKFSDNPDDYR